MKIKSEKLKELQKDGKKAVASVVKSHFGTTYYHVVDIDALLQNAGKWLPAVVVTFPSGARGRLGISGKYIDWSKTVKLADIRNFKI